MKQAKKEKNIFGIHIGSIKPVMIKLLLVSVLGAGIVGIISLLSGEFGELQSKILLTVILTSGLSVGMLIYLTVMGSAYQLVGLAGSIVAAISFVLGMWLIWKDWNFWGSNMEYVFKNYAFSTVIAIAIAHICLIVRLLAHKLPVVRIGIALTIGFIAVLTALIGSLIYFERDEYITSYRVIGVLGILILLGTVILPVWARIQKK